MATANPTTRGSGFHADPETGVCYRMLDFMGQPGCRVGDDGSVWSCRERSYGGVSGARWRLGATWRRLRGGMVRYATVCFPPNWRNHHIHRIVLESFVGPCPPGMQCLHGDDNKLNNSLGNLRWGTPKSNSKDAIRNGKQPRGERHGNAKLTAETVRAMRADHSAGLSIYAIIKKYRVPKTTATRAVRGESWAHVSPN